MTVFFDPAALPTWANGGVVLATIVVIAWGAHQFVEAAAAIGRRLGISELVVGLTIVALGTSAPEFAVTLIAAFKGQGDVSVGNIVGSNIFNLGFILGGCALVRAIPTHADLLWRDGMLLGGSTLLIGVIVGWDLQLDRADGAALFALLLVYLGFLYRQRKRIVVLAGETAADTTRGETKQPVLKSLAALIFGLILVVGGSHVLVLAATSVARSFGVSDWVIAVTIVAAGTSAPEFATSIVGVVRGRYAMSAGALIGSDLFNLLGVLGVAGMVRPVEIDAMARVSLLALSAMVLLVLFFMRTGWRISRLEGLLLVIVAGARWTFDFWSHGQ